MFTVDYVYFTYLSFTLPSRLTSAIAITFVFLPFTVSTHDIHNKQIVISMFTQNYCIIYKYERDDNFTSPKILVLNSLSLQLRLILNSSDDKAQPFLTYMYGYLKLYSRRVIPYSTLLFLYNLHKTFCSIIKSNIFRYVKKFM